MGFANKRHSQETRAKMSQAVKLAYAEGRKIPYMLGKNRPEFSCEKNPSWKGDSVGYSSLHRWLKKRLPKPVLCQICQQTEVYDLANLTGAYTRDLRNWQYLCRSCHVKFDHSHGFRKPRKHSDETKQKIKLNHWARKSLEETKKKIADTKERKKGC